jgi:hypothetical protein
LKNLGFHYEHVEEVFFVNQPYADPEELYAMIVEAMLSNFSDVTSDVRTKKFGSSGELKLYNKIFATLSKRKLVIKLPHQRVDELIASGKGKRFDPGHGRFMKEWITLEPTSEEEWLLLVKEALEFVTSKIK